MIQQGPKLLREQTKLKDAERTLLKALLDNRAAGTFAAIEEGRGRTDALITAKRREHVL